MTGYVCIACGQDWPADFSGYVCRTCGGNLDVQYDYAAIRAEGDPKRWFTAGPRTDQFRFGALLPVRDLACAPPLRVGATPLYLATRLGAMAGLDAVYLKDEGLNPSQSFKDRASAMIMARAVEAGVAVVAGASTGNAGSSLACMAAAAGRPCVVFVPERAPPAKLAQLLIFGAWVIAVRGSYDDAFDLCARVCEVKGWLNRNTGFNPFTREGKKTAAFEILEQCGDAPPDRIVVPTGDGNIISGIWKGLKEAHALGLITRLPRVDCAQAEGSAAITRAVHRLRAEGSVPPDGDWRSVTIEPVPACTLADSIAVDDPRDGLAAVRAVVESGGEAVAVPDEAILEAIKDIARHAGVFVEPSCACAWAALRALKAQGKVESDERVVVLLTGSGLKDIASARKVAGAPLVVDPDLDAALGALDSVSFEVD